MAVSGTLNVRIDDALKERGNRVFARRGISTTAAVRKLYEYADREQDVPDWMIDQAQDVRAIKRRQLRELVGSIDVPSTYDARADYRAHLDEKYKDLIA
ncbi:hypothetical protein [Adlercreutzia sp. ZJ138]|uniref:type II toxin-antitoxin system RelB/DinJ family antitoxin n=1 Tax=Adlercreutzia sp. ZJ138 TaxID=2709405 RepID=UPI0013EE31E5|nr:hypothetical protein [Adlercreutzia sp. ZJ138]